LIARSVQIFQKGESGQGRHFLKCASADAERTGDAEYVESVRLLIAEEQRHAADLGRFLDLAGIGRIERTWSNGAFRWLRRRAGLKTIAAVLVSAEIIARVYYLALYRATNCPALKRLRSQILRDERAHVQFQCVRLALIRWNCSRPSKWLKRSAHAVAFRAACLIVWSTHARVFRPGGFEFLSFWNRAVLEFRRSLRAARG
jgi:hypothetical protein